MNKTMDVFSKIIKSSLEVHLGKNTSVSINKVTKNNGLVLTAVTIKNNDSNLAPNIYLDSHLIDYNYGKPITAIIDDILKIYKNQKTINNFDVSTITDFHKINNNICCKLVNAEKNKQFLSNAPHKLIHDLAIVFYIIVERNDDYNTVIEVTNDIFSNWNITLEQLNDLAFKNTMRIHKESIITASELMKEFIQANMLDEKDLLDFILDNTVCPMFVVTNDYKVNGAITMFYDNLMKRFAKKIGGSFYILPSSVHETLFIPFSKDIDIEYLYDMVRDVNKTAISEEEYLSDSVYYYDVNTNSFGIA